MPIAFNLEFLVPVIIGVGCLLFSIYILVHNSAQTESETVKDESDIVLDPDNEKLEPGRKIFYVVLFAGLGMASIVFGFSKAYPLLHYAAKGIIVLAIIASIILNIRNEKKSQDAVTAEDSAKDTRPDV